MKKIVKKTYKILKNTRNKKSVIRICPICGWKGKQFGVGGAGDKLRFDSCCPQCSSMERHRLSFLVAKKKAILDYSEVLHVAPEPEIEKYLRHQANNYLSIDLYSEAMQKMDITNLDINEGMFTLVWISHVLEHIQNDLQAISEIHRVLKPQGKVVVQVPIWRALTYEDSSILDQNERIKSFYQSDHVRLYGLDIVERFLDCGFSKNRIYRAQDFGPKQLLIHGLAFASTNEVFIFEK